MDRRKKFARALSSSFLTAAIFVGSPGAFAQASPATTPKPQNQREPPSAVDRLTPYQKSQLDRILNDWAYLAKYRDADKELGPVTTDEARVVFMGDSITEGWGTESNGNVSRPWRVFSRETVCEPRYLGTNDATNAGAFSTGRD